MKGTGTETVNLSHVPAACPYATCTGAITHSTMQSLAFQLRGHDKRVSFDMILLNNTQKNNIIRKIDISATTANIKTLYPQTHPPDVRTFHATAVGVSFTLPIALATSIAGLVKLLAKALLLPTAKALAAAGLAPSSVRCFLEG